MSTARFQLRNQTQDGAWSPFDDGDFEAATGDVIEAKLEDTPALDIWQTVISCIDRCAGRTQVTLDPSDGTLAAPDEVPTDIVEVALPADEEGTWELQCQVNDGVDVLDSAGRPDATVTTKTRMLVVRTANLDLRHPLADDLSKDPEHAAVALQEMIDAVDAQTGAISGDPVLVDATTSGLPGARLLRGLAATIPVLADLVAPLSLTRRDANDDGSNDVVLSISRSITAAAAGLVGDKASIEFKLPATSGTPMRAGRLRAEVVSPTTISTRSMLVLSVKASDGEHDALTIEDDGDLVLNVPAGQARTLLCEGQAVSLTVGAAQRSGNGANAGVPFTILAGQGQSQTGGAANNNGGALTLASGAAGTGGGGAAGVAGALSIKTGGASGVERIGVDGAGALLTLTATAVKAVAASGIQADGGFDSATATPLKIGTSNATTVRLPYSKSLSWRNQADDGDVALLTLKQSDDSADHDTGVLGNDSLVALEYRVGAVEGHRFYSNGGQVVGITAAEVAIALPLTLSFPVTHASYSKASLPSASPAGQEIYVTDETGGAVPAFSDGTNWRRYTDRNVVS